MRGLRRTLRDWEDLDRETASLAAAYYEGAHDAAHSLEDDGEEPA